MPDLKVFTLAAMGAFVSLPAFAQETPTPEDTEQPEEICRTFNEFTEWLRDDEGELPVPDMETTYLGGPDFEPGVYKLYANPETGGWTLAVDPFVNPSEEKSKCQDDDHVFWRDGDIKGYPYGPQNRPWYNEIFDAPTFL